MFVFSLVFLCSSFIFFLFSMSKTVLLKKEIKKFYFEVYSITSSKEIKLKQAKLVKQYCEKSKPFKKLYTFYKIVKIIMYITAFIFFSKRYNYDSGKHLLILAGIGTLLSTILFIILYKLSELSYSYSKEIDTAQNLTNNYIKIIDRRYIYQLKIYKMCAISTFIASLSMFICSYTLFY